jgi:chromosome segregation ATPase
MRQDTLEKTAFEKEKLYNEIKIENDQLANQNYKLSRTSEDLTNEKRILETKLRNTEASLRSATEEGRQVRNQLQQLETKHKMLSEEYEVLQRSFEELSLKKQSETELFTKEIQALVIQDKEAKQRLFVMDKEVTEARDHIRLIT